MADSEMQLVTSQTPATKQKNPKHVAAGKAIAEKTRQACEAQKKALAEAQVIIANNQLEQPPVAADLPPVSVAPLADPPPVEPTKNVLTTTQWLSVISIFVSLAGVNHKREEIKSVFTKKPPASPPSPVLPQAPPPSRPSKEKSGNQKDGLDFCLFITMVDALLASLKAATVGGIFMVWTKITIEALKLSWHIISLKDVTREPVRRVVCEECKKILDAELDGDGKYVCFTCRGI